MDIIRDIGIKALPTWQWLIAVAVVLFLFTGMIWSARKAK